MHENYDDTKTQKLLNKLYGSGNWDGLNTVEKRMCWKWGYDNPILSTGKFSNPDTEKERFHAIRLGPRNTNLTSEKMDAFYATLGQVKRREQEDFCPNGCGPLKFKRIQYLSGGRKAYYYYCPICNFERRDISNSSHI